jgi:hypothetical protein
MDYLAIDNWAFSIVSTKGQGRLTAGYLRRLALQGVGLKTIGFNSEEKKD